MQTYMRNTGRALVLGLALLGACKAGNLLPFNEKLTEAVNSSPVASELHVRKISRISGYCTSGQKLTLGYTSPFGSQERYTDLDCESPQAQILLIEEGIVKPGTFDYRVSSAQPYSPLLIETVLRLVVVYSEEKSHF